MSVISRLLFPKGFINASFIVQLAGDLELVYKEAFMQTDTTVGTIKENNVLVEVSINDSTIYEKLIVDETEQFYIQHTYFANESNEQQKFIELKEIDDYLNTLLKPNQTISRNELERYIDNQSIFINYILKIDEVNNLSDILKHTFVFDFMGEAETNQDYNIEEALNYHINEDLLILIDNFTIRKAESLSNDLILTVNNRFDAEKITDTFLTDTLKKYGLKIEHSTRDTVTTSAEGIEKLYLVYLPTLEIINEPTLVTESPVLPKLTIHFDFDETTEKDTTKNYVFDEVIKTTFSKFVLVNQNDAIITLDYGADYVIERTIPNAIDFSIKTFDTRVDIGSLSVAMLNILSNAGLNATLTDNKRDANGEFKEAFYLITKKEAPPLTVTTVITEVTPVPKPTLNNSVTFSFLFDARVEFLYNEQKIGDINNLPSYIARALSSEGISETSDYTFERKGVLNFKIKLLDTTLNSRVFTIVNKVFEDNSLKIIKLDQEGSVALYRATTLDTNAITNVGVTKVEHSSLDKDFDLFKVTNFELRETHDENGENNSVSFELPRLTTGIGEFAIFYSKMNMAEVINYIKNWTVRDYQTKDMEGTLAIVSWQYADGGEVTFKGVRKTLEGSFYRGKGDFYFYVVTLDNGTRPINDGKFLAIVGESNSFAVKSVLLQSGRDNIEDFSISFFPPQNTSLVKQYAIFYSLKKIEEAKDLVYDYTIDYWNELASDESALIVPTTWADGKAISLDGLNKTIEGREFDNRDVYYFYVASINYFYLDLVGVQANPKGLIKPITQPIIEREVLPVTNNQAVTEEVISQTVYVEKIKFVYDSTIKNDVLYAIADEIDGILHWTFKAQNNQYQLTKGAGNDFEIEFRPIAQQIVARLLNILPSKLDEYELDFIRNGADKTVEFLLKPKAIVINAPTLISQNVYFDEEYSFMFEFDKETLNNNEYDVLRRVDDYVYDEIVVPDRDNFSTKDYDWQRFVGNSFEIIAKNRKMFDKLFDQDFFEDAFYSFGLEVKVTKQTSARRTYTVSVLPTQSEKERAEQINKLDTLASSIARIENMLLNFLQKTTNP